MIKKGEVNAIKKGKNFIEKKTVDTQNSENYNVFRPKSLNGYIGQPAVKEQVELMIAAAKARGANLDHTLIFGPPGLGKTTLAAILAEEMQSQLRISAGPALEKQGDLAAILSGLNKGDILFIDEIHRLRPNIEEILYSAMEDFALDIVIGKGPTARSMRITIPEFTLVGATTKPNMLSSPLRDRFGSILKLDYYSDNEITEIILRSAKICGLNLSLEAAQQLAAGSRRTPRIANRLLKRVRDYCLVNKVNDVSEIEVTETLRIMDIDEYGLSRLDRELLSVVLDKFNGGPVGLGTIAALLHEEELTLAEICEPFLMQLGFLQRTHRGRIVTESGKNYLLALKRL